MDKDAHCVNCQYLERQIFHQNIKINRQAKIILEQQERLKRYFEFLKRKKLTDEFLDGK